MGEVTSEKARERVCVSDHAQRSTGQAGFRRKQTKSETWRQCSAVINNSETHASLCLSSLKKYIPSLMNVVKVTWPRKKGSKMIDIRFRQIDAWLYCMVGHQDEKDPKILICCWRWRPEDPCYLLLDIQLKIIVVWIMSEHCTEWSRRDPKINITYLECCWSWSPAKIIIPGSDNID